MHTNDHRESAASYLPRDQAIEAEQDAWGWIDNLIHGARWAGVVLLFIVLLAMTSGYVAGRWPFLFGAMT